MQALSRGAGALAAQGAAAHTDDPRRSTVHHLLVHRARVHWKYLLWVYRLVRLQTQSRDTPRYTQRQRPEGQRTNQEKSAPTRTGRINTRSTMGRHGRLHGVRPDIVQGQTASDIEAMASTMRDIARAPKETRPRPQDAVGGRVEMCKVRCHASHADEHRMQVGTETSNRLQLSHKQENKESWSCSTEWAVSRRPGDHRCRQAHVGSTRNL